MLLDTWKGYNRVCSTLNTLCGRVAYVKCVKILVKDLRTSMDESHKHIWHMDYRVSVMSDSVYILHILVYKLREARIADSRTSKGNKCYIIPKL